MSLIECLRSLWSQLLIIDDCLNRMADQLEEENLDSVGKVYVELQHRTCKRHVRTLMEGFHELLRQLGEATLPFNS